VCAQQTSECSQTSNHTSHASLHPTRGVLPTQEAARSQAACRAAFTQWILPASRARAAPCRIPPLMGWQGPLGQQGRPGPCPAPVPPGSSPVHRRAHAHTRARLRAQGVRRGLSGGRAATGPGCPCQSPPWRGFGGRPAHCTAGGERQAREGGTQACGVSARMRPRFSICQRPPVQEGVIHLRNCLKPPAMRGGPRAPTGTLARGLTVPFPVTCPPA
jgi:hypothetical protein